MHYSQASDALLKEVYSSQVQVSIEYDVPSLKHGFYEFAVNLNAGEFSGQCGLKQIEIGLLETHSRLDPELCGQGYGTTLYSAAIRFSKEMGFRVCSSRHSEMTRDARILWLSRGLNSLFDIRRDEERFWVL